MIKVSEYINNPNLAPPCFVRGDALVVLRSMPNDCIDCVVTSPPYYMKRQYLGGGIGLEKTYQELKLRTVQIVNNSADLRDFAQT